MYFYLQILLLFFQNYNIYCQYISFENLPTSIFSSTLLELHIKALNVKDCLHLLDGRFNQLRVFKVKIESFVPLISKIYKVDF
jgi:hypothetical protein